MLRMANVFLAFLIFTSLLVIGCGDTNPVEKDDGYSSWQRPEFTGRWHLLGADTVNHDTLNAKFKCVQWRHEYTTRNDPSKETISEDYSYNMTDFFCGYSEYGPTIGIHGDLALWGPWFCYYDFSYSDSVMQLFTTDTIKYRAHIQFSSPPDTAVTIAYFRSLSIPYSMPNDTTLCLFNRYYYRFEGKETINLMDYAVDIGYFEMRF